MVAVPVLTPVTTPLAFTVATAVLPLVHVPPASPLLVKVVVVPIHTDPVPLIVPALAFGLTVTNFVVLAVPQVLVTW